MKRIISLTTASLLALSLCSCSREQLGLVTQDPAHNTAAPGISVPSGSVTDTDGTAPAEKPEIFGITSDAYYSMLAGDKIIKVDVTMAQSDLASMRKYAVDEAYYPATVTVDGAVCDTAGIRTRGNVTYVTNSQSQRYSYRLNFNKYGKDGNINGLDELCLNNMAYDPSFLREYLTYKAFAYLDADAPLVSLATVSINGESAGVYLAVEAVEGDFLKRCFGNSDGNLYKAGRDSTLVNGSYGFELNKGSDTTLSNITALSSALKANGEIENILDVPSVLKYAAVNAVITNEDSYMGEKAQNYYLYESNGKFTVLPWDYNLAFGTDTSARKDAYAVKTELTDFRVEAPYFGGTAAADRPLVSVLLENDGYKKEYLSYIEKLTEFLDMAEKDLKALETILDASVSADETKFYSYELFKKEFTDAPDALFGFMKARNMSVKSQLDAN